jgi:hypothetical protein
MQGTKEDFQAIVAKLDDIRESAQEFPPQLRVILSGLRGAVRLLNRKNVADLKPRLLGILDQADEWEASGFAPGMDHVAGLMETLSEFCLQKSRERSFAEN